MMINLTDDEASFLRNVMGRMLPPDASMFDWSCFGTRVTEHANYIMQKLVATPTPMSKHALGDKVQAAIDQLSDVLLRLDGHADAAEPAFDEIIKLCGLAKTWEYPAQVVRDVEDALKTRDDKIAELRHGLGVFQVSHHDATRLREERDAVIEHNQKLRAALVYARDRRGNHFDFDEWISQVEHALDNKIPPHAIENAQAKEAQAWAAVASMRSSRDQAIRDRDVLRAKLSKLESDRRPEYVDQQIDKMREERDAARAELRDVIEINAKLEDERHVMTAQGKAIEELRTMVKLLQDARDHLVARRETDAREHASHVANILHNTNVTICDLRDQLRFAESVRDDAREASRRDLDAKRTAVLQMLQRDEKIEQLRRECGQLAMSCMDLRSELQAALEEKRAVEAAGAELTALVAKLVPTEPPPEPGQCPWLLPDAEPDEGYWHCKFSAGHRERHVTELGRGAGEQWHLPDNYRRNPPLQVACPRCRVPAGELCDEKLSDTWTTGMTHFERANLIGPDLKPRWPGWPTTSRDTPASAEPEEESEADQYDRATGELGAPLHETMRCGCSEKYRELAPGVHAKYCPLAGQPLGDRRNTWRCSRCDFTFKSHRGVDGSPPCFKCGESSATTEVAGG
jgi:hypothetical protein